MITKDEDEDEIIINNALPVVVLYDTIKKIKLVNPQQATVGQLELTFFPYFILKFSIKGKDSRIKWIKHKENSPDTEKFIINAIDGQIS